MTAGLLDTALIDVGGTLWPNDLPLTNELQVRRATELATLLEIDVELTGQLILTVEEQLGFDPTSIPDDVMAAVLEHHSISHDPESTRRARQSMCVRLAGVLAPFPGAGALLSGIRDLGMRSVIVSNTGFRDAELYQLDFESYGWDQWIDGYVTTIEAGCSKPDPRIFHVALGLARSTPERCVMIGNSPANDIAPALVLGMRTILMAVEEPVPPQHSADACVTTLDDALEVLRRWQLS